MATPRATWTTAMLALLDDGRWYEIDQVITVGMRAVPPGRAIQQREQARARLNNGGGPRPARTDDHIITVGARSVARASLDVQIRTGHIERSGQLIRRRP